MAARRIQYSIRSLLLLLTVGALVCAFGHYVHLAREKARNMPCDCHLAFPAGYDAQGHIVWVKDGLPNATP